MSTYHTTVLLQEAIENLQIKPGEKYIDATLGGGGHTRLIVENGGIVLGIDADDEAIAYVKENFQFSIFNFQFQKGNFKDIDKLAQKSGFNKVNGILFDLGVSGNQVDKGERGFSFAVDAPLDMRMDTSLSVSAKDLVNGLTKDELGQLFVKYGEEGFARKIAGDIVASRQKKSIETTGELEKIVRGSIRNIAQHHIHPATRVFQALRIAVNDELNSLEEALPKAVHLLEANGRLVIISFHSLEDRIVKQSFLEFEKLNLGTIITKKPVVPREEEIEENSRSRSAKLRVFERI